MNDARKLRALIIEDQAPLVSPNFESRIDIERCSGLRGNHDLGAAGALELMRSYHCAEPRPRIDILVVDVDMSKDPALRGWDSDPTTTRDPSVLFRLATEAVEDTGDGAARTLAPYGPAVALPFLAYASSLFVVAPVSAYWSTGAVTNNGFFLVSMSLVATAARIAKNEEADVSPEDVQRLLRTRRLRELGVSDRNSGAILEPAIINALRDIRDELPNRFYFFGIEPVVKTITALLTGFQSKKVKRAELVRALDGLAIDLPSVVDGRVERILVTSLFADVFVEANPEQALDSIRTTMETWARDEARNVHPLVLQVRTKVMDQIQMPVEAKAPRSKTGASARATTLLAELGLPQKSFKNFAARRYMALMAWTRGWYFYLRENAHDPRYWAMAALGLARADQTEYGRMIFRYDAPNYYEISPHKHFLASFRQHDGDSGDRFAGHCLDEAVGFELLLSYTDIAICRDDLAHLERIHGELNEDSRRRLPTWLTG
jgi:hypothetical protein